MPDNDDDRDDDKTADELADLDQVEEEHETPDDALEPADDMFHPVLDEEKLDEDNTPPAAPPSQQSQLPPDHPMLDTDLEPSDVYNSGVDEASDFSDWEVKDSDQLFPLEPEEDE